MLDRKIKDIDARAELLEDRKKNCLYTSVAFLIAWAFFLMVIIFAMAIYDSFDLSEMNINTLIIVSTIVIIVIIIAIGLSIKMFILSFFSAQDQRYYSILIYLKRNFEKGENDIKEKDNENTDVENVFYHPLKKMMFLDMLANEKKEKKP